MSSGSFRGKIFNRPERFVERRFDGVRQRVLLLICDQQLNYIGAPCLRRRGFAYGPVGSSGNLWLHERIEKAAARHLRGVCTRLAGTATIHYVLSEKMRVTNEDLRHERRAKAAVEWRRFHLAIAVAPTAWIDRQLQAKVGNPHVVLAPRDAFLKDVAEVPCPKQLLVRNGLRLAAERLGTHEPMEIISELTAA